MTTRSTVPRGTNHLTRPEDDSGFPWTPVALGLLGLAIAVVVAGLSAVEGASIPIGLMLIPVLVVALLSSARATAVVGATAVLAGIPVFLAETSRTPTDTVRLVSFIICTGFVIALCEVRRRRDLRLREQEAELVITRQRESSDRLLVPMLERLPEMSGARDIPETALRTCRIAREVFGADNASYWQLEGDECVLLVREPPGDPSPPLVRMPREQMSGESQVGGRSRTIWIEASSLPDGDPRRELMLRAGASAGTSTPVRVDFVTVGYLALSWNEPQTAPEVGWLETLDRLADQMALAKTVVRRRIAQQEARELTDRLQASFLPTHVDTVPDAVVRILYRPGTRQLLLGGDFLDVAQTPSGGTAFLIGDVSGHGPEQAALAATLRAAWRGAVSVQGSTLEERVAAMDAVVHERRPTLGLFVTVISGELDADLGSMRYVAAGHPPPLLVPTAEQTPIGGPPLGVVATGPERDVVKVDLHEHEGVLLVTDGLFEGRVAPTERERLGFDAFADIVADRPDLRSPQFLEVLADELERRNGARMPDDAAALLLLRRPLTPDGFDGVEHG